MNEPRTKLGKAIQAYEQKYGIENADEKESVFIFEAEKAIEVNCWRKDIHGKRSYKIRRMHGNYIIDVREFV